MWKKTYTVILCGLISSITGPLLLSTQQALSSIEGVGYFVGFFLLGSYVTLLLLEKYEDKIVSIMSSRWRKVTSTFRFWLYGLIIWLLTAVIGSNLLSPLEGTGMLQYYFIMFLGYSLYGLLFWLPIYSVASYVPCCRYLASPEVERENKKKIANALTGLTPLLGFPLIVALYLALLLLNISIEPWLSYTLFFSFYVTTFLVLIDLPYCTTAIESRKRELDTLKQEREALLQKLQSIDSDTTKGWLKKITLENEIARLDRKKQEIKSESIHPYKLVVPFMGFIFAIFGAIITELMKMFLQLG